VAAFGSSISVNEADKDIAQRTCHVLGHVNKCAIQGFEPKAELFPKEPDELEIP
jgi:hypothetical protein